MDDIRVFLEKMRSKQSSNNSGGLNVQLKGNRKLLPLNEVSDVISYMEQYKEERNACNKIRLTCQVNPICSNVLFNRVSEIVKYEGSSAVTFLNYGMGNDSSLGNGQVVYKPKTINFWSGGTMTYDNGYLPSSDIDSISRTDIYPQTTIIPESIHPTNSIRDTQLSKNDISGDSFVYHCGLDIFNNHLIRSNTFKCVNKLPEEYNEDYTAFNTIADFMREANGDKVIEKVPYPVDANIAGNAKLVSLHTYLYDDLLTFNETIKNRLIEKHNGWFGFYNKAKIKTYKDFVNSESLNVDRPIMYKNGGDFIDMYPGRDLYSFVPLYNKYRNRIEKNWNYCITYPSSSTTNGFDDIIEDSNNSLKAVYFDENTRSDNGSSQLVIYGKSKHGLSEGDYVNVYKTYYDGDNKITSLVIENAKVETVVDPFIFTTFTQGKVISSKWVELEDGDFAANEVIIDNITYNISPNKRVLTDNTGNNYFVVNGEYVNLDPTAQDISYKKVVNGIECDYYVRIFSKLPNFKFASGDTSNEYELYKNDEELIRYCQDKGHEFESHVSRLAFAKNIYSDDIGEIVFTDDIDLSNLHDNLGRPLSEVFLTIIKNNAGYKEWYGFDNVPVDINSKNVEFSHCFGRITCGFEMSDESIVDVQANNIKAINNEGRLGLHAGYSVDDINGDRGEKILPQEVFYDLDKHFYGDLCCYDNYNAIEQSIQPMLHRFNTAQRECGKNASMGEYFETIQYDEIKYDDYDDNDFEISTSTITNCNSKHEGYYYQPHYQIRVKSFGKLNTIMPQFLSIRSFVNNIPLSTTQITTLEYHYLTQGDKAIIYDQSTEKYYYLNVVPGKGDDSKTFTCTITDEKGNSTMDLDGDNTGNYKLFKIDNLGIPSYAHLLKDGTCRYIWRNIINNGSTESDKTLEVYPFTNGAFYINRKVDLYVRRQDPYDRYGLYNENDVDIFGVEPPLEDDNYYHNEDEIKC